MDGLAFWLVVVPFGLVLLWGFIVLINIVTERLRVWVSGFNGKVLKDSVRYFVPSKPTRIALILALTAIIAVWLVMYMSPYQTCIRSVEANDPETTPAALYCARELGNR